MEEISSPPSCLTYHQSLSPFNAFNSVCLIGSSFPIKQESIMVFGGVVVCMKLAGESPPDWFEPDLKDNWFGEGELDPGFNK